MSTGSSSNEPFYYIIIIKTTKHTELGKSPFPL